MARDRPQIGDVFEILAPNGRGYLQYVKRHDSLGELVRVLHPVLVARPTQFHDVVSQSHRFFTFFPLSIARARRIVEWVGREAVPPQWQDWPMMRSPGKIERRKVESWWIWDGKQSMLVERLTDEQSKYSIKSIINDTLLIEHLVSGWTPSDYV